MQAWIQPSTGSTQSEHTTRRKFVLVPPSLIFTLLFFTRWSRDALHIFSRTWNYVAPPLIGFRCVSANYQPTTLLLAAGSTISFHVETKRLNETKISIFLIPLRHRTQTRPLLALSLLRIISFPSTRGGYWFLRKRVHCLRAQSGADSPLLEMYILIVVLLAPSTPHLWMNHIFWLSVFIRALRSYQEPASVKYRNLQARGDEQEESQKALFLFIVPPAEGLFVVAHC